MARRPPDQDLLRSDHGWVCGRLRHPLFAVSALTALPLLVALVNLLNPERVVLTGWAAMKLGPWLLAPTSAQMLSQSITGSATATQLTVTSARTRSGSAWPPSPWSDFSITLVSRRDAASQGPQVPEVETGQPSLTHAIEIDLASGSAGCS